MTAQLQLGDIRVDVVRKDIKHIHLGVYPPMGRVRISAPEWMALDSIRLFAVDKLAWIKRQQEKLRAQPREAPREYIERESHYVWGRRYLLRVIEKDAAVAVELTHRYLRLQVRPGMDSSRRAELLEQWYRARIHQALPALLTKWEPVLGVNINRVFVQRMKTRWGGCNAAARNIRLNTELAKKPPECLEYILVHELIHLREPTHNQRFLQLMHEAMPNWRLCRDELNRLPLRQELWEY